MKFSQNFKDYLIFIIKEHLILIILLIILISLFYQNFYPNEEYLQNNSIQQTLISGVTSVFNGYTETLTSHATKSIGSNPITNIGFTIVLLLVLGLLGYLTKNRDKIFVLITLMLLAQFIFVPIWWYFNKNFSGGLSLWNTFILFVLIFELISTHNYGNLEQKASSVLRRNTPVIIFMALAIFILNINSLRYRLIGFIMFIVGILIWLHYFSRLRSVSLKYGVKLYLLYSLPLAIGALFGALVGFFLLPFNNSGRIIFCNPHLLSLPIFVLLFLAYKFKYKNSPISLR